MSSAFSPWSLTCAPSPSSPSRAKKHASTTFCRKNDARSTPAGRHWPRLGSTLSPSAGCYGQRAAPSCWFLPRSEASKELGAEERHHPALGLAHGYPDPLLRRLREVRFRCGKDLSRRCPWGKANAAGSAGSRRSSVRRPANRRSCTRASTRKFCPQDFLGHHLSEYEDCLNCVPCTRPPVHAGDDPFLGPRRFLAKCGFAAPLTAVVI